jgi:hypothetical protein
VRHECVVEVAMASKWIVLVLLLLLDFEGSIRAGFHEVLTGTMPVIVVEMVSEMSFTKWYIS